MDKANQKVKGVSIILIAYYGDRWLPNCLESLKTAGVPDAHLVLADNAGNTVLGSLGLRSFRAEKLDTPYPMGFAAANNYALTQASSLEKYILFLNQDTISPPGWLDACIQMLEAQPQLGALSPLIRNYDDTGWDPSFLACLDKGQRASLEEQNGEEIIYTQNAPAPALLVRTEILKQVGPFDPVFGSYYEDYDLCRRIRRAGYRIGFCRSARIRHFSGSATTDPAKERKRMRQVIRNRVLYELREQPGARWPKALKYFLRDFPHRLGRGLARTPSSQPPIAVIRAYGSLLAIARRLFSRDYDESCWRQYLHSINWKSTLAKKTAVRNKA